jgi:hypothetical protein
MSDVNLQLVREFFELNLFRVMTNWQQDPQRFGELSGQLFVEHIDPTPSSPAPDFLLTASDAASIHQALVEVRAWHGERFYPSVIGNNPVLTQFAQEESLALAQDFFTSDSAKTILVISELPASTEQRERSLQLLKDTGVDHILEFATILGSLLEKVSASGHYPASQTLEMLRLLKRYRFIRNQQMEFGFAAEPLFPQHPNTVDTAVTPEPDPD